MRVTVAGRGEMWKTPIGEIEVDDYKLVTHKSGKFFARYLLKDLLQEVAEDMHKNIREDYDNFVVIVGGEGAGKSNATYDLLSRYDPELDIEKCYTYNNEAFRQKILAGKDIGRTFWMDEGSVIANNRDWQSKESKAFVQTVETCRSRHYTIAADIPVLDRLDIYLRESRMRYLIKCAPMSFDKYGF